MNRKRISYSALLALAITTIAYVFYDRGGEFVLWPGLVAQVMLNGLLLAVPTGDDYHSLPGGTYLVFNVILYASMVFTVFWLTTRIRGREG